MNQFRIEYDYPSELYFRAEGLSHSESKQLRRSPFHYKQLKEPRAPDLVKRPTANMELGTMVHVATLEPHAFNERYVIGPDLNKNTTVWKQFAAQCEEQGTKPITEQQRDQAFAMAASLRALPDFAPLLDGSANEVSMWWNCPATGVLCKARPDLVKRFAPTAQYEAGFVILGDVKTTEDASAEAFARAVCDYSYYTQCSWYTEGAQLTMGIPVLSFLFAVVEREYPYACASYTLDDNAMKVAADINKAARELYVQCEVAGKWPGYPSETRDIALPPWYMKKYLEGMPV